LGQLRTVWERLAAVPDSCEQPMQNELHD
jgi:hypothetical protein